MMVKNEKKVSSRVKSPIWFFLIVMTFINVIVSVGNDPYNDLAMSFWHGIVIVFFPAMVAFIFANWCKRIARSKNKNTDIAYFIGFFLGLIAVIYYYLASPKDKHDQGGLNKMEKTKWKVIAIIFIVLFSSMIFLMGVGIYIIANEEERSFECSLVCDKDPDCYFGYYNPDLTSCDYMTYTELEEVLTAKKEGLI